MLGGMPDRPFSAVVGSEVWRGQAEEWLRERCAETGRRVIAEIEQPRIRPWSTQLVAPTDAGRVWFKATCPAQSFEPALQAVLAAAVPDRVDPPLAIDALRGWMLTCDRGATLAQIHRPDLEDWQHVVHEAALVQREVAGRAGALLATGLPDCSPASVPARFDALLDQLTALPAAHPSQLTGELLDRLSAARPRVEQAAATLDDGPMPVTLQHGDLHPGNLFVVDDGVRLFDFGDAQLAHPLETLAVPWAVLTHGLALPWEPVLAAYHAAWSDLVSRSELDRLLRAAMITQPVNRTQTWCDALAMASPAEVADWGEAPLRHLSHVILRA